MDLDALGKKVGLDAYDVGARLRPAFLTLFPLPLTAMTLWPAVWEGSNPVLTLVSSVGGFAVLVHLARDAGRKVEKRLGNRVGREHSARLLSHADDTLPRQTKERMHAFIEREGRLNVPSATDEQTAPDVAADDLLAGVTWLLEATRPTAKDTLIYQENIAYGFRRNARGLRTPALVIAFAALVVLGLATIAPTVVSVDRSVVIVPLLLTTALSLWWLIVVRDGWVCAASDNYAGRLLSAAERAIRTPDGQPIR